MLRKDESLYLDYAQDILNKVDCLWEKIIPIVIPDKQKQELQEQRINILAKVDLLKMKAKSKYLIPNATWIQIKKEIDDLYLRFFNSVNPFITCVQHIDHNR